MADHVEMHGRVGRYGRLIHAIVDYCTATGIGMALCRITGGRIREVLADEIDCPLCLDRLHSLARKRQ